MYSIAFDSHKRYTLAVVERSDGSTVNEQRIEHEHGNIEEYLRRWEAGTAVAIETVGNWYWIVDEIERAGMRPRLVHALKAKLMIGSVNKTDRLDARGLNRLQRAGTLPEVWIPSATVRDLRELQRTRMVLVRERTRLKNRISATLAKYGMKPEGYTDVFTRKGRLWLEERRADLPRQTCFATERLLAQLDGTVEQIEQIEQRLKDVLCSSRELELLRTLPGVGFILASVILSELGQIDRFATASRFASYSGTTPRVHASGGKTRIGQLRSDVNRYLKWAFVEAANVVCMNQRRLGHTHVYRVYTRLHQKRGHQKAIGAVARHLAEAAYWVLSKGVPYQEFRQNVSVSSREG